MDVETLRPSEPLSNFIIDHWVKRMSEEFLVNQTEQRRFCFLPAALYTNFCEKIDENNQRKEQKFQVGYKHVKDMTKDINIFEYTYVFFVINPGDHWILTVLRNEGKQGDTKKPNCIWILDPLYKRFSKHHDKYLENVRQYFALEYKAKVKRNVDFSKAKVPKIDTNDLPDQPNEFDCGIYVLGFIEQFLKDPFVDRTVVSVDSWKSYPFHLLRQLIYSDIKCCTTDESSKNIPVINFTE